MNQLANDIQEAAGEIRRLRNDLALAHAKLDGFEMAFHLVNSTPPNPPRIGNAPDIAWALEKHAQTILASDAPDPPK